VVVGHAALLDVLAGGVEAGGGGLREAGHAPEGAHP
jgi:hypothetical protein